MLRVPDDGQAWLIVAHASHMDKSCTQIMSHESCDIRLVQQSLHSSRGCAQDLALCHGPFLQLPRSYHATAMQLPWCWRRPPVQQLHRQGHQHCCCKEWAEQHCPLLP